MYDSDIMPNPIGYKSHYCFHINYIQQHINYMLQVSPIIIVVALFPSNMHMGEGKVLSTPLRGLGTVLI